MKHQLIGLRGGAAVHDLEIRDQWYDNMEITYGIHEGMLYIDSGHWHIIMDTEEAVENLDKWLDTPLEERKDAWTPVFTVTNGENHIPCELRGAEPAWLCVGKQAFGAHDKNIASLRDWIVILRAMLREQGELELRG